MENENKTLFEGRENIVDGEQTQSLPTHNEEEKAISDIVDDAASVSEIESEKMENAEENTEPETQSAAIYTYTSSSNVAADTVVSTGVDNDPTVRFDTVVPLDEGTSNKGIKVFFTIIAITVALIIAVSTGFIFGSKAGGQNPIYNIFGNGTGAQSQSNHSQTQQVGKDNAEYTSNRSTVFQNVNKSVVCITVYNDNGAQGYASGVIYTADGYIVTNDHIYSEVSSPKFLVTMYDGTEYKGVFVAGDTRSDLAIIKVEAQNLPNATFGISGQVVVGEEVVAIGYPSGAEGKSILTSGTISSSSVRFSSTSSYSMKMIQTDTPINPGNSGGALVNMFSQVIGIPSVKMAGSQYDNVGYAIPSDTVVKVADSLIKYGYVEGRGRLGISYTAVDTLLSEIENIPVGLKVQEITIESDLIGKGIKIGDVITHINDTKITESSIALDIIESTIPGDPMSFTVYHVATGESKTVIATLLPDHGSSSYKNKVTDSQDSNNNPFENGDLDDFFSDH